MRLQKPSCPVKRGHPERWPSGLRRTLGKRVCGKLYRGFESHSLRQLAQGRAFSGGTRGRLSSVTAAISHLSPGLPLGRAGLLFSKRPVSLRSSGLYPFGTLLEIRTFGVTYKLQRKEVPPLLSDNRERPISNSPGQFFILDTPDPSLTSVPVAP